MDYNELLETLGIGDLPALNDENHNINEILVAKQLEVSRFRTVNAEDEEVVGRVFRHWTGIKEGLLVNKNLSVARKQEVITEKNLQKYHKVYHARNLRDGKAFEEGIDLFIDKNETLEEEVNARATINELLEDEHMTDVEALLKWSEEVDDYEEDIFTLLRYQNADMNKVNDLHLKLEKMRETSSKAKQKLDECSTDNKMSQLALKKTASEFRTLHEERLKTMENWQEAVSLVDKRNDELQQVFTKVGEVRAKASNARTELKEQTVFLENERANNRELQRHIDAEEGKAQRLSEEVEAKEGELDRTDGDVILEKREIWRIGGEIDSLRAKWKQTKDEYKHKLGNIEELKRELDDLKQKHIEGGNMALTAEERAEQMASQLNTEQKTNDSIQLELEKTREKKIDAEKELYELDLEYDALEHRIKGLELEKNNAATKLKNKSLELTKKEEINLSNGYALSQLEREISRLKGGLSEAHRAELKTSLDGAKTDLELKLSDKRNLDHLVHKMMADVRKVTISISQLSKNNEKVKLELEQVVLMNDTCIKEHKQVQQNVEALLLEEKMLKLNERKAKQSLEELNQDLLVLQKQDLEVNEKLREQREELENKQELYIAQSRCIKDEIATVRGEIRERKDRVEKLKIKYGLIVKSLGEAGKSDSHYQKALPSHAFQLVKLAQEKAELRDQGEMLAKRIGKEEKELLGLENTINLLRNSNNKYRTKNVRKAKQDEENDELDDLKDKINSKLKSIRQLRKELQDQEEGIQDTSTLLLKCESDIKLLQRNLEDKNFDLQQLENDSTEQDKKYNRANNIRNNWEKQLRTGMLLERNPDFYEMDMDLRAEKEKQRGVMIKLNDISNIDGEFASMCISYLQKLGFDLPALNRLMSTPGLSRRGSKAVGTIAGLSASRPTTGGSNNLFRGTTPAAPGVTASGDSGNTGGKAGSKGGVRNRVVVEVKKPTPETDGATQQAV